MEYFVRNCVLHRSMQNKHSYLEHEMKYFFKALAKEPKKGDGHVNTLVFSSTPARWNSGTVPVPEYNSK